MPVPGNTVSSLWSESSQHAWTVTHAWNTTKSFAQTGESLKLSATDNWSESTLMHVSNTRTDSLVTLLTFDSRWRGLLSDGVDSFSVCEVISCQWHCEGAKEAVLGDLRGGYTDVGRGGQNPTGQRKYCVRNTARGPHILFLCPEANKYCINLSIIAWKVHKRVIEDFKGVCVCTVTDWSRGVFLLFQSWDIWHLGQSAVNRKGMDRKAYWEKKTESRQQILVG